MRRAQKAYIYKLWDLGLSLGCQGILYNLRALLLKSYDSRSYIFRAELFPPSLTLKGVGPYPPQPKNCGRDGLFPCADDSASVLHKTKISI